ncbi:MAG TPA: hypothetical protein VL243_05060 [Vicinamibacterales bacterium]|nr:hypothetical protein [Vicinamibacterales bacterium]
MTNFSLRRTAGLAAVALCVAGAAACRRQQAEPPPVATPSFSVNQTRVPLGSPVEVTYKFTVAKDAPKINENYRVFVHFLDSDKERMWTDDHDLPVPTTQWKPGQVIEYTKTMFVPIYPYMGQTKVLMGLYSQASNSRLPLAGENNGQRAYTVGTLELLPQTENIFVMFKDGWHPAETPPDNAAVEWQWTKKEATLSVRNPKKDVTFYLHLDSPGVFNEPQQVTVTIGDQTIDSFTIQPKQELIRKPTITAAQLGTADTVDLKISVDKTYVPAVVTNGANRDPRELGVRVFHAYVQPKG